MEAIAGLSLAANIFQVIDFSHQVVSAVVETYTFGSPKNIKALEKNTLELKYANDILDQTVGPYNLPTIPSDQGTLDLAREANVLAAELLDKVDFAGHGKIVQSLCVTIKSVWNRDKVEGLRDRLRTLRELIEYRIIISLRAVGSQNTPQLAMLDAKTSDILRAVIDSRAKYRDEMQLLGVRLDHSDQLSTKRHDELLKAIKASTSSNYQPNRSGGGSKTRSFWDVDNPFVAEKRSAALLSWLRFARMDARRAAISAAHETTFEWIFDNVSLVGGASPGLSTWLERDSGCYWIKGKAGSGKSTLMKFLASDRRTHQRLRTWARARKILFSAFYFWYLGTEMQKSQLGLLRGILCDLLTQELELIPTAFPDWQLKYAEDEPCLEDVVPALARVLQNNASSNRSICLFIDGLDEFHGDGIDMTDLAQFLQDISHSSTVKILVSSRPLQPFEDCFQNAPQLKLQDLTQNDISRVVKDSLQAHPRMAYLLKAHPERAEKLLTGILKKSDGVFLWVTLAIKAIREGFQNHDGIDELERRLSILPKELDAMFSLILRRIPQRYHGDTLLYLEILRRWYWVVDEPIHVVTFLFAAESARTSVLDYPVGRLSDTALWQYLADLDVKLKTRSMGLLELREPGTSNHLDFIHRSVYEFLSETTEWRKALTPSIRRFNVDEAILNGMVVFLKTKEIEDMTENHRLVRRAMIFHDHAQKSGGQALNKVLDQVNSAMMGQSHEIKHLSSCNTATVDSALAYRDWPNDFIAYRTASGSMYHNEERGAWRSDFLSLMVLYGCHHYVEGILSANGGRLPPKEGRPLLSYAVDLPVFADEFASDIQTHLSIPVVDLLLKAGADPNENFQRSSPWWEALSPLHFYPREEVKLYHITRSQYHTEIVEILIRLVAYGADRKKSWAVGKPEAWRTGLQEMMVTPSSILHDYLREPCVCGQSDGHAHAIQTCGFAPTARLKERIDALLDTIEERPKKPPPIPPPPEIIPTELLQPALPVGPPHAVKKRVRLHAWFSRLRHSEP